VNLPAELGALKAFAGRPAVHGACDLCSAPLCASHPHVLDTSKARLECVCGACTLLFLPAGQSRKLVVPRAERLSNFALDDATWDTLAVPIGLAFFVRRSDKGRVVATYPSPAGATVSLLPLDAWSSLVRTNPILDTFASDVEALLVNRVGLARTHYRVSIDRCFALVGLVRSHWHGLSGGARMHTAFDAFFAELDVDA
jgi:hypothetical protein